jgi:hypothetical protein
VSIEATMRASTAAQATELNPSLRAARSRTRRRLHEPRPAVTTETRRRIGLWKAELREAAKARQIRAVDRLYADELLAFPTVTRGLHSLCSDARMGERTGTNPSGARRARRRLDKAGLIEVRGYGEDGNSCLVRPILRDGTPVFPDLEVPIPPVNLTAPPPVNLTADLLKEETLRTEEPPLPPAEPAAPEGGEKVIDQQSEDRPAAEPQPVEPVMTFLQFWLAIGQTGKEGYARASGASSRRSTRLRFETG